MSTSPNANDASDIAVVAPANARTTSIIPLPIRGEKRIIPTPIDPISVTDMVERAAKKMGRKIVQGVDPLDFNLTAAKSTFTQYIVIRIPGRGVNGAALTFEFLINPRTMSVSKQTIDSQALTRAGWQFGVWGEDMTEITMQGTTAGQYFSNGLTDDYQEFTVSYRNTLMLTTFFENNGYFFEGESAGAGPLAADFTRRRIKMHQDVQLIVGNYIWYGMFNSFTLNQKADCPYKNEFTLTFTAWKERYRSTSPYPNSIQNNIQRGHSPQAFQGYGNSARNAQAVQDVINQALATPSYAAPTNMTSNPNIPSATVTAAAAVVPTETSELPWSIDVMDSSPTDDIVKPTQAAFGGITQGGGISGRAT